ncbi:hypothetical protein CRENBAI_026452 [Crenichthys baileyi]|uniref:Meiosis-specific protein MEI4 n=1 Tax=Crenichthys baileyi TaxID=28760 RepID=A0AAV9R3H2_9TELE
MRNHSRSRVPSLPRQFRISFQLYRFQRNTGWRGSSVSLLVPLQLPMEKKLRHLNGSSRACWPLTKARVAVAVAVIKTRPPGMSGREHAEALGRRIRRQDEAWKETAQGLQQEVLRLRQELLISRATPNTKSSMETADETIMVDMSQDLFGRESPVCVADCDSETPDLFQEPASPPSNHQRESRRDALLPQMQFLQSLWSLHRLDSSSSRGVEALCLTPEGDGGSVVAETICLLLDSVVAACKEPPVLRLSDLVLQACQVASRALDLICSPRWPSVDFMRRVEEPIIELTQILLHSKPPSRAAEKLTESLIALGSSSISKSLLICHILSEISSLAEQLWQTSQVETFYPLDLLPWSLLNHRNRCSIPPVSFLCVFKHLSLSHTPGSGLVCPASFL